MKRAAINSFPGSLPFSVAVADSVSAGWLSVTDEMGEAQFLSHIVFHDARQEAVTSLKECL